MKKEIHPENYRLVIFEDTTSGARFLIGSTIASEETAAWEDGTTYPLVKVEISSKSHPFYTGERKEMDTAGRADRFRTRVAKAQKKQEVLKTKTPKKRAVKAAKK